MQRAKEVLTDEENRKNYDAWRRCGVAVSFKEWCARKECIKTVSTFELRHTKPDFKIFFIVISKDGLGHTSQPSFATTMTQIKDLKICF